ncbi:MAG: hypothetical protein R8G01_10440 [Ilumatobacteraceae bacterium]|nr:hypothetical protein [Ilumatobacteraceae bacterium]
MVDVVDRPGLDDIGLVHHGDAITDARHDSEVEVDEHVGHAVFVLEVGEQAEHLRLRTHVEARPDGRRACGRNASALGRLREGVVGSASC